MSRSLLLKTLSTVLAPALLDGTVLYGQTRCPSAGEVSLTRPTTQGEPTEVGLSIRVGEVDPLTCTECGSKMRILAFLLDPPVVRKILDHLAKRPDRTRAPPAAAFVATAASR